MNDHKSIFKKIFSDPQADHQDQISQLLTEYPYVQALHVINGEQKYNPSLYKHALWNESQLVRTVQEAPAIVAEEEAPKSVSVYHDEHLPYSFLWWLNKTRSDYAHTYKPYADVPQQSGKRRMQQWTEHEKVLLDHQIRENIFHLQDPEEKLSPATDAIPFQVPKKSNPVIEKFIQEDPKISPPQPEKLNFENKARGSASDHGTVVTETLAKIYEEQGLYPKAVEVYERLSLKFPKKSGYFADRIVELKNKLT